jgi:trimeric autotransporter adhesin
MNSKQIPSVLLLSYSLFLSGCGNTPDIDGLTSDSETPTSPAATATQTSDIYSLVSAGESLSFNGLTGGVNDLAVNPSTQQPGVAYYDKSSTASGTTAIGALKYAFRDEAGKWNVEIVDANYGTAACGTANSYCVGAPNVAAGNTASIIRLAFNSEGLPAIAYVYGASAATASGYKQVRFAERDADGDWTISSPFSSSTAALATNVSTTATVDPIKGVTLLFDSEDRPHITFALYTQTITSSQLQYLFRSSSNVWTSSTIGSAVTGAGTITAVGQGMNQSGGKICAASGMPMWAMREVDAAAGSGKTTFVSCTAKNSAGACTTFSSLNLSTGCGTSQSCLSSIITTTTNSGSRVDLAIDAATQRPILATFSTATPATSLLTVTAPVACDLTQTTTAGSWGTPLVVGAASQGLNGFRIFSSSTSLNLNFLAYLTSTTTVSVNKSTGPDGAWFSTGSTIETTTVAGEGVGAAYDVTGNSLYVSYASLPGAAAAAVGNDIKVASAMQEDLTDGGAAGPFVLETVDNMNNFFPTTAIPTLASASSSRGLQGFAGFFQDATVADSRLYYGVRAGTSANPIFSLRLVANHIEGGASPLFVGSYPSLTYDSTDNPVIAFYNGVAAQQNLNVARSNNGGVSFSVSVVDDIAANVGQYPSVASYEDAVGIAYYDVTNTALKFARFTPSMGWRRFAVDGMTGTGSCGNAANDAGSFAVLKFTSTGLPVIAYRSQTGLKIAMASEATTSATYSWSCVDLDASGNVTATGIAFALGTDNSPHILHFDSTLGEQRYVRCAQSAATCIATGPSAFSASVLAAVGTTSTITTKPSLQVNSSGDVYATFYSASYKALALARLTSGGTAWSLEYLDAAPSGTSFVSLAGQYASLTLNSSGYPVVFYRSWQNWLKYFSREIL